MTKQELIDFLQEYINKYDEWCAAWESEQSSRELIETLQEKIDLIFSREPKSPEEAKKNRAEFLRRGGDLGNYRMALYYALETQKEAYESMEKMINSGVIDPYYMYYARTLVMYLEEGRADTLQEAIKLLERDLATNNRV